jgi:DNA-binding NarL/FixJ family response regulator
MIRVVVADDHPVFREGIASLLKRTPDIELVGAAATGEEATLLARDLLPDVVLMDLAMPGRGGIEATRQIVLENPHIGVLVVTMFEDDESVFAAVRAGGRGYVLKDADPEALLRAIRAVARGEALLGAGVALRVLREFARVRPGNSGSELPNRLIGSGGLDELTPREREVLHLIAQGRRNRDIAEELVISEKTVNHHVSNIFSKLQVEDRAQAIVRAREAGLGLASA